MEEARVAEVWNVLERELVVIEFDEEAVGRAPVNAIAVGNVYLKISQNEGIRTFQEALDSQHPRDSIPTYQTGIEENAPYKAPHLVATLS